ncbi:Acetate transporter protein patA [Beauveria bassiana]|nr:Acetate transporter protein patA [Beauveria bassiana]
MEWRGVTILNVYVTNFFFAAAVGLLISAQWELTVGNGFSYTVYSAFDKARPLTYTPYTHASSNDTRTRSCRSVPSVTRGISGMARNVAKSAKSVNELPTVSTLSYFLRAINKRGNGSVSQDRRRLYRAIGGT